MDVVTDAEMDNDRTSVWQFLQATKVEPSSNRVDLNLVR